MTTHIQQDTFLDTQATAQPLNLTSVLTLAGLVAAVMLVWAGFPLLVSLGLWLLGLALTLIAYAFVSHYRFRLSQWEPAIAGQALGMGGLAILLVASLTSF